MHKSSLFFLVILGCCLSITAQAGSLASLFAPKAELWAVWQTHNESSTAKIDHQAWDAFLSRNVVTGKDGINRIAYASVSAADKHALADYISRMQHIAISQYSRAQQKAYWANLYNAETVNVVLQHYPVKSIRDIDISPGFFSDGPWGKKLLNIENRKVSLNDIEHRILRPVWHDNRLHYALNCASLGCPNLQKHAFWPDTMDTVLEQAAKDYINHPRGARFKEGGLYVSSIYNWFQGDFGGSDAGVIAHLKKYAGEKLAARLAKVSKISGDDYNWALNDASPVQSTAQPGSDELQ